MKRRFLTKLPPNGVTMIHDSNDDPSKWKIVIAGPKETPYEGGAFRLLCCIPTDYPFKYPSIKFITKIYHASVLKDTGEIDPSFYKDNWMPSSTIKELIQLIIERFFLKEIDV